MRVVSWDCDGCDASEPAGDPPNPPKDWVRFDVTPSGRASAHEALLCSKCARHVVAETPALNWRNAGE